MCKRRLQTENGNGWMKERGTFYYAIEPFKPKSDVEVIRCQTR